MKKKLTAMVLAGFMLAAPATAFAHGHGRSRHSSYARCNITSCTRTYTHKHNGRTYAGHYSGDGHSRRHHR